jgi:ParB-like chromosome segregation protein Spo0J
MNAAAKIPTTFSPDFATGNVKAAMKDAGAGSGDLYKVPVDKFVVLPGFNVRTKTPEYEAHIESLTASILANGFNSNKPLGVIINDSGEVVVYDGHTRLEAAKRAIARGAVIETLPAVTAPRGTTMADLTVGLVTNNAGKQLTPIEVAAVCKRLMGWGWDEDKIAKHLSVTKGYVNDLLGLLEAPEATKQLVAAGMVAAGTAIKLAKKVGAKEAAKQLQEAAAALPAGKTVTPKHLKAVPKTESAPKVPQAHISAAAAKVPAPVFSEAALKKILKAVFDDKGFNKLSDKVQSMVIEVVG